MVFSARYGWSHATTFVVVVAAAFNAAALALAMPLVLRAAVVIFFGLGGLAVLLVALTRRIAVEFDAAGIRVQAAFARRPRAFAWSDVDAVVFWDQQVSARKQRCVGILPKPHGVVMSGDESDRLAATSIALSFVRLDRTAFVTALRSLVAVPVIDWPTTVLGPTNDEVRAALTPQLRAPWPVEPPGSAYRVDR
jgi:hypothetical protein